MIAGPQAGGAGAAAGGSAPLTRLDTEVVGFRLSGDNVGGATVGVRVGGSACEASWWASDSTVWCRATDGFGKFDACEWVHVRGWV